MIQQEWLYKKLAEDLSKERLITKQVEDYITDHYGYSVEDLPRFFTEKVSQLEDYEIDLTFSPLFTPTLEDRAGYIPILVAENLTKAEVKQVVDQLVAKNIYGHFITPNRQNLPMVLTDVCINRFVERLYLDRPIHPDVFQAIELVVPEKDRPMAQVLARKPNWQAPWRQQFLVALLKTADARKNFKIEKLTYLSDFLKTYRPNGLADLVKKLESLIQSCQQDLETVRGRSFHDPHLKEMYADAEAFNEAAQAEAQAISQNYKQLMAYAEEILQDYWSFKELFPEWVQTIQKLESAVPA